MKQYAIVQKVNPGSHLFIGTKQECKNEIKKYTFITCEIVALHIFF